jgi:Na+-driven multidrug efflux pump
LVFRWGLAGIWTGLAMFMLVRLVSVVARSRSGAWAVTGAVRH